MKKNNPPSLPAQELGSPKWPSLPSSGTALVPSQPTSQSCGGIPYMSSHPYFAQYKAKGKPASRTVRKAAYSASNYYAKMLSSLGEKQLAIIGDIGWDNYEHGTVNTTSSFIDRYTRLKATSEDTVHIIISSAGGDMNTGNAIYAFLKAQEATIHTHVLDDASSAALTISLAGSVREWLTLSTGLVHAPSACRCQNYKEALASLKEDELVYNTYLHLYTLETGMTRKQTEKVMDESTVLNSKTALKLGFATTVKEAYTAFNPLREMKMNRKQKREQKKQLAKLAKAASQAKKTAQKKAKAKKKQKVKKVASSKKQKAQVAILTGENKKLKKSLAKQAKKAAKQLAKSLKNAKRDAKRAEKVRTLAKDAGFKAGKTLITAQSIMRTVLSQANVPKPQTYSGRVLKQAFRFALSAQNNQQADSEFSGKKGSSKSRKDPWKGA